MPVPVKFTNCGLPAALSAMLKVAEREPVACGAKVTPIEQFPPATTLDPQLVVCRKSPALAPPTEIAVILSSALPELVSVTLCTGLVTPWFSEVKERLLGEVVAAGAGGGPVLALPPPPQPTHIEASTIVPERTNHARCLARLETTASVLSIRNAHRRRPAQAKLKCNRRKTGRVGIDFGTMGAAIATAVVATLIVAVAPDVPVKDKEAGVAVQFAPTGAPEHVRVTTPLKPPSEVKASE
jgi:hypothetical protein